MSRADLSLVLVTAVTQLLLWRDKKKEEARKNADGSNQPSNGLSLEAEESGSKDGAPEVTYVGSEKAVESASG